MKKKATNRRVPKRIAKSGNTKQLSAAFTWFVGDSLKNIKTHGNAKWAPLSLAVLALLWLIE